MPTGRAHLFRPDKNSLSHTKFKRKLSMATLIIQASARAKGNTNKVAEHLLKQTGGELIDLLEYTIHPFSYDQEYPAGDQFYDLFEDTLLRYDHLIFATPVYWYTMSALLKNFLDRFSDLLMSRKGLGRQLRGKRLSVLSVSNDALVPPSFQVPFTLTADYLGMDFGLHYHGWLEDDQVQLKEELPF